MLKKLFSNPLSKKMEIRVVKGAGEGITALSAFDSALKDAGVYNYNLICLSSIIPPNSKILIQDSFETPDEEYGYRLYVVKAEMRSNKSGKFIAAGVGWYQYGDDDRGLFVEHEIEGDTKAIVESAIDFRITNSLKDLCQFRGIKFEESKVKMVTSISQVKSKPGCVLVIAVFKAESWE